MGTEIIANMNEQGYIYIYIHVYIYIHAPKPKGKVLLKAQMPGQATGAWTASSYWTLDLPLVSREWSNGVELGVSEKLGYLIWGSL